MQNNYTKFFRVDFSGDRFYDAGKCRITKQPCIVNDTAGGSSCCVCLLNPKTRAPENSFECIQDAERYMLPAAAVQTLLPKTFVPPFRVGKRQGRAILDANGHELGIFATGYEAEAQRYCNYLNELANKK